MSGITITSSKINGSLINRINETTFNLIITPDQQLITSFTSDLICTVGPCTLGTANQVGNNYTVQVTITGSGTCAFMIFANSLTLGTVANQVQNTNSNEFKIIAHNGSNDFYPIITAETLMENTITNSSTIDERYVLAKVKFSGAGLSDMTDFDQNMLLTENCWIMSFTCVDATEFQFVIGCVADEECTLSLPEKLFKNNINDFNLESNTFKFTYDYPSSDVDAIDLGIIEGSGDFSTVLKINSGTDSTWYKFTVLNPITNKHFILLNGTDLLPSFYVLDSDEFVVAQSNQVIGEQAAKVSFTNIMDTPNADGEYNYFLEISNDTNNEAMELTMIYNLPHSDFAGLNIQTGTYFDLLYLGQTDIYEPNRLVFNSDNTLTYYRFNGTTLSYLYNSDSGLYEGIDNYFSIKPATNSNYMNIFKYNETTNAIQQDYIIREDDLGILSSCGVREVDTFDRQKIYVNSGYGLHKFKLSNTASQSHHFIGVRNSDCFNLRIDLYKESGNGLTLVGTKNENTDPISGEFINFAGLTSDTFYLRVSDAENDDIGEYDIVYNLPESDDTPKFQNTHVTYYNGADQFTVGSNLESLTVTLDSVEDSLSWDNTAKAYKSVTKTVFVTNNNASAPTICFFINAEAYNIKRITLISNPVIEGIKQSNNSASNVLPTPINDGYLNSNDDNNDILLTIRTQSVETNQSMTVNIYEYLANNSLASSVTSQQTVFVDNTGDTIVTLSASVLQSLTDGKRYVITADVSNVDGVNASTFQSNHFIVDRIIGIGTINLGWGSYLNNDEPYFYSTSRVTVNLTSDPNSQNVHIELYKTDGSSNIQGTALYTSAVQSTDQNQVIFDLSTSLLLNNSILEQDSSYIIMATTTDSANNSTNKLSAQFMVDRIATIQTISYDWGSSMNNAERNTNPGRVVTVTTNDVENGRLLTLTLAGQGHTSTHSNTVNSNSVSIQIPLATLQSLTDGTYSITTSVSDMAGNYATKTGSNFTLDTSGPSINSINYWYQYLNKQERQFDQTVRLLTSDALDLLVTLSLNLKTYQGTVVADVYGNSSNYQGVVITVPKEDLQALVDDSNYTITASVSDSAGNNNSISRNFHVDIIEPSINAITHSNMSWGMAINNSEINNNNGHVVIVQTNGVEDNQQLSVVLNNRWHYGKVSVLYFTKAELTSALRTRWWYEQVFTIISGHTFEELFGVGSQDDSILPNELLYNGTLSSIEFRVHGSSVINGGNVGNVLSTSSQTIKYVSFTYDGKNFQLQVKSGVASVDISKSTICSFNISNQTGIQTNLFASVSDAAGNQATSRTSVNFLIDPYKPVLLSSDGALVPESGEILKLTYNENLVNNTLNLSKILIHDDDDRNKQLTVKESSIDGQIITLMLNKKITQNQVLTITYNEQLSIQDVAGNFAIALNQYNVTNNSLVPDRCKIFGVVHRNFIK